MYKKVGILTSTLDTVYATVEEWAAVHGKAGVYNHEYVTDGTMTLNEDGRSVTVEWLFESEEVAQAFKDAYAGAAQNQQYTVEVISEAEVV